MKNDKKQAVILNNLSSPYIHQAIIILNDCEPIPEDKVIEDAERIVSAYLKTPPIYSKKQRSPLPFTVISCLVSAIFAAVITYLI